VIPVARKLWLPTGSSPISAAKTAESRALPHNKRWRSRTHRSPILLSGGPAETSGTTSAGSSSRWGGSSSEAIRRSISPIDERGAGQRSEDLGDALASLEEGDATRGEMGMIGKAISCRGEIGVALGRGQAAAHGLNLGD
jgi:hypothetical protein